MEKRDHRLLTSLLSSPFVVVIKQTHAPNLPNLFELSKFTLKIQQSHPGYQAELKKMRRGAKKLELQVNPC
jgi:N-acyl-L-homoserine lactone synthetase